MKEELINVHTCKLSAELEEKKLICQYNGEANYITDRLMKDVRTIQFDYFSSKSELRINFQMMPDLRLVKVISSDSKEKVCENVFVSLDIKVVVGKFDCSLEHSTPPSLPSTMENYHSTDDNLRKPLGFDRTDDSNYNATDYAHRLLSFKVAVIVLAVCVFVCTTVLVYCLVKKKRMCCCKQRQRGLSIEEVCQLDAFKRR
ncbi:hypothetical protein ACF0H5_009094 [Mactra antiquata]